MEKPDQRIPPIKEYAELSGIDGEPIEFEWNIFSGFTSIEILRKIQEDLEAR